MKVHSTNFLIGVFLILIGVLFLTSTLGPLRIEEEYTWAILFFSAGLVMILAHFLFDKKVWTLILGGISMFIGTAIFIDESRILPGDSIGILFFVIAGIIFLSALRHGKPYWWTLIPGGFCLIVAAHILMDMNWWIPDEYHAVIFFGGSGLLFGIIYLLKDDTYRLDWAQYPSIIAFTIAGIVMLAADSRDIISRFIFPLILILLGSYVVFKSVHKQSLDATGEKQDAPKKE